MPKIPKEKKKHSYSPYPDKEEKKGKTQSPPPFSLISSRLEGEEHSDKVSNVSYIDFEDDIDESEDFKEEDFKDDIDYEINDENEEKKNLKSEEEHEESSKEKRMLTFREVEEYLNESGIECELTSRELGELIDASNEEAKEVSVEEFCESLPSIDEIDEYEEACDEEKKGNLVSRIAAPKWVRNKVYSTEKDNKYYKGKVNGEHQFDCMYCKKPVILDKDGKEKGFKTGGSGSKRQPPVCHGKNYPAVYVRNGVSDLLNDLKLDPTLLKHCSSTNTIIQQLVWEIGIGEMMPGHTKCNVKDKDTPYGDLKSTQKKQLLTGLKSFMMENGPKGKLKLKGDEKDIPKESYLGKISEDLKNFSKKSN